MVAPKGQPWWLIGAAGAWHFLIMAFYSEVVGWVFACIAKSRVDPSTDPATNGAVTDLVSSPTQSLLWQWLALVWVGAI